MNQTQKKQVSQAEYDKRVESEFENLRYFDRLDDREAWAKAKATIAEEFEVERRY